MKIFYSVLFTLMGSFFLNAQSVKSCCASPGQAPNDAFVALANDPSFKSQHDLRKSDVLELSQEEMIEYPAEGRPAQAYSIKANKPTDKWVFVFHEWWGLNDFVKAEAVKLHRDLGNVNVLCLDLYDGKTATTREGAAELMQGADAARIGIIINGARSYVGSDADVATLGWCFGGGWSLQAAIMLENQASGCVIYYGMPEEDIERLRTLQTDVLGIFANKDQWINEEVVGKFEENAKKAGVNLSVYDFDADHAFANPSNSIYNEKAANEAYQYALSFLKSHL